MNTYSPQIYVACLASYNNGVLHGAWIDADQDAEDIEEEIKEMLADSPEPDAEEWAIHDYDDLDDLDLGEYESLETISQLGKNIVEHGELFIEVYKYTNSIEEAIEMIKNRFIGLYDSVEDYAEGIFEVNSAPEHLRPFINVSKMAKSLESSGDIVAFYIGDQVAIFSP